MTTGEAGISYDAAAWFYERLAHAYSLGQIRAAKLSQLAHLRPGARVLYVGAGAGEDAVAAAAMGCGVTCLDLSPRMLERTRRGMQRAGVRADLVCCDVMNYRPEAPFDAVAANFFFNIFPEELLMRVLLHVATLVKSGGGATHDC